MLNNIWLLLIFMWVKIYYYTQYVIKKQLIFNLSNFTKLNRSIYLKPCYLDRFIGNANRYHSQSRGKVPDRDSRESNKKRLSVAQPEYKFIVVLGDLADNESLRDGSLKAPRYGYSSWHADYNVMQLWDILSIRCW